MATLKICTNQTRWITEVDRVDLCVSFDYDGEEDPASVAFRTYSEEIGSALLSADFPECIKVGRVIRVYRQQGRNEFQTWIVPADSCFLMTDSGKTIDHF